MTLVNFWSKEEFTDILGYHMMYPTDLGILVISLFSTSTTMSFTFDGLSETSWQILKPLSAMEFGSHTYVSLRLNCNNFASSVKIELVPQN